MGPQIFFGSILESVGYSHPKPPLAFGSLGLYPLPINIINKLKQKELWKVRLKAQTE